MILKAKKKDREIWEKENDEIVFFFLQKEEKNLT